MGEYWKKGRRRARSGCFLPRLLPGQDGVVWCHPLTRGQGSSLFHLPLSLSLLGSTTLSLAPLSLGEVMNPVVTRARILPSFLLGSLYSLAHILNITPMLNCSQITQFVCALCFLLGPCLIQEAINTINKYWTKKLQINIEMDGWIRTWEIDSCLALWVIMEVMRSLRTQGRVRGKKPLSGRGEKERGEAVHGAAGNSKVWWIILARHIMKFFRNFPSPSKKIHCSSGMRGKEGGESKVELRK